MLQVIIKYIYAKNFLSIGEEPIKIEFKKGLNIITGINYDKPDRTNGVGKSNIAEILHFSIFGSTIRELTKELIVNYITNEKCITIIEFDIINGTKKDEYKIERTLNPSKCTLIKNGENITLSSITQTNALICQIIHFTPSLFQDCVIMTINSTKPFMAQQKIEKRKFIEGILNLEVFGKMLLLARNEYNEIKKDFDIDSAKLVETEKTIKILQMQRDTFEEERKRKLIDITNNINIHESTISSLTGKIVDILIDEEKNINSNLKLLKDKLDNIDINNTLGEQKKYDAEHNIINIKEKIKKLNEYSLEIKNLSTKLTSDILIESDVNLKILKNNLENNNSDIQTIKQKKYDAEHNIINIKEKITEINTKKGICKFCDKNIDHLLKETNEQLINKHEISIKKYEFIIEEQDNLVKTLNSNNEKINTDIIKLEKQLLDHKLKIKENDNIKSQIDQIKKLIKSLSNIDSVDQIQQQNEKYLIDIKNCELIIEEQNTRINQSKNDIKKIKDGIIKLEKQLLDHKLKIKENDNIKSQIDQTKKWIKLLHDNQIEIINNKGNYNKDLNSSELYYKNLDEKINKTKEQLTIIDTVKYVVSEEGVKSLLIKKIIKILNNKLLYYHKKLDAKGIVTFDEYFDETIINNKGKICSYFNFSGAERKAIDLACLFTFIDLRRLQGDVTINVSMYDELFDSSLDEKGIDLVLEILKDRIDNYNEAVYIISHRRESIKHVTGDIIFIEMRNDISRIIPYQN